MSTWTNIPDATIETGKPIKAITGRALRDNTVAVAEGATGAPRIKDAALDTTVTTAGTDWVLARTAAGAAGAVGTYMLGRMVLSSNSNDFGDTRDGSDLQPTSAAGIFTGPTQSGTWRCMGKHDDGSGSELATLWLRIS